MHTHTHTHTHTRARTHTQGDSWTLSLLQRNHEKFADVKKPFLGNWKKNDSSTPTLERVFKIKIDDAIFAQYVRLHESILHSGQGTK